jgi:hypothetical protein
LNHVGRWGFRKHIPSIGLYWYDFEQNPAGIKQVFQSLGTDNTVRLPLVSVDESLSEE